MELPRHQYICKQPNLDRVNRKYLQRAIDRILEEHYGTDEDGLEKMFVTEDSTVEEVITSGRVDGCLKTSAYGYQAIPRLRREMSSRNLFVALEALMQLSTLVHDPENAAQVVNAKIIPRFVKCLKSEHEGVVRLSLDCLRTLSHQPTALNAMIHNKYIVENIKDTINHPESEIIRSEAAGTVNALVTRYLAISTLVDAGYAKALVRCLIKLKSRWDDEERSLELKNTMVLHLDSLDKLMEWGEDPKVEAIAHDVHLLIPLINEKCQLLRRNASAVLSQMAKNPIGKELIHQHGLTQIICKAMMEEVEIKTKINLATALQFATIHKEIRKEAFKTGIFEYTIETMIKDNATPRLKMICIHILTNFAELPEGRSMLYNFLSISRHTVTVKVDGTPEMTNALHTLMKTIMKQP